MLIRNFKNVAAADRVHRSLLCPFCAGRSEGDDKEGGRGKSRNSERVERKECEGILPSLSICPSKDHHYHYYHQQSLASPPLNPAQPLIPTNNRLLCGEGPL